MFSQTEGILTHKRGNCDQLQVCWGSYDTLTGHGLNVQKIKKGMLHYLDLEKGLC